MNKWISSLALSLLVASLACPARAATRTAAPGGSNDVAYGAAVTGDSGSSPSAVLLNDPNSFGDGAGFFIAATTAPSCFAGVDWPTSVGSPKLSNASSGTGAPNSLSFLFEVPKKSLDRQNPANPNLTIVVQDNNADYYYAGKNQGVTPSYQQTNSAKTADQFLLKAKKADFTQANTPSANMAKLTRVAIVWSGWNTLGGSANITSMFVTGLIITNNGTNNPPAGYQAITADSTFNFD